VLGEQLKLIVAKAIAYEHEESAAGIVCVGAPVFDRYDRVVTAVSVTGPVTRFHPVLHAAAVHVAAAGIASTMARRESMRG